MKKKIIKGAAIIIIAIVMFLAISVILEYAGITSLGKDVALQIPRGASEKKIA